MLKNIDVRFFVTTYDDGGDVDSFEIEHQEFVDRYVDQPQARIDVELHSLPANGVRQLCITINEAVDGRLI